MDANLQFAELMRSLTSPSNETRKAAEASFEQLCTNPEAILPLICVSMTQCEDDTVRAMSAVMFRKRVSKNFLEQLSPASQAAVKSTLISAIQQEKTQNIRRKIADTTGEVGATIMGQGEWPELLAFVFGAGKSESAEMRESAMLVLSRLTFSVSDKLIPHIATLCSLFQATLQDPQSKEVRLAALNASSCLIQALSNLDDQLQALQVLIPALFGVVSGALNEQDEESARSAMEDLISVAEEAPKFFRRSMDPLVHMCFTVSSAEQLDKETRFLAVEMLLTLSEQAPAMMRKQQAFVANIVPLALKLMVDVDEMDLAQWNSTTEDEDDSEMTSLDVGKDCLDRLALSLGGKTIFAQALRPDLVPSFLAHPDWKYRHAALCCLSQIAEGCKRQMLDHLGDVVRQITACFADQHPRVRWAAINAVGQLETDLGPDLQNTQHDVVLPALVQVMDDVGNPRVQSHAAAAVINFTENCDKLVLGPYLDGLLSKLVSLLVAGTRIVQEQAITAIASVADCVESGFAAYYPRIMPTLKQLLFAQPTSKELRLLRGKAMECISLIGIAVGREVFLPDAKEVMDQFMATQTSALDPDDPQASYLLQAWGRLAKALKSDFIPYLNFVMPPLLKAADIKVDTQVEDAEHDGGDEEDEEEGISTVLVETDNGTKKVALKTSALEEKATACNMLVCYFAELREGMFPWIESVVKVMVPLISFIYHDEVRTAAAALMPEIVRSAVAAMRGGMCDAAYLGNLCSHIFAKVLPAIIEDPEPSVQLTLIEALQESCDVAGAGCLQSPERVAEALKALATVAEEVLQRTEERAGAAKDEDFDEDEAEALDEAAENDAELLDGMCTALASVTRSHPELVVAHFKDTLAVYSRLVSSSVTSLRRIGICALDEVLEHMGPAGAGYISETLPALVQYAVDPAPEVRQAAVFGLGVCAQHGGPAFAPFAGEVVARLVAVMQHPQARSEENVHATDNAASALGKVIEFQQDGVAGVDAAACAAAFVGYLPMGLPVGDKEEGVQAHGRLCTLLEKGHPALAANPAQSMPKIIAIFAAVLQTETVNEEVSARIVALLRSFQTSLPAELLQGSIGALSPDHKAKLQAAVA